MPKDIAISTNASVINITSVTPQENSNSSAPLDNTQTFPVETMAGTQVSQNIIATQNSSQAQEISPTLTEKDAHISSDTASINETEHNLNSTHESTSIEKQAKAQKIVKEKFNSVTKTHSDELTIVLNSLYNDTSSAVIKNEADAQCGKNIAAVLVALQNESAEEKVTKEKTEQNILIENIAKEAGETVQQTDFGAQNSELHKTFSSMVSLQIEALLSAKISGEASTIEQALNQLEATRLVLKENGGSKELLAKIESAKEFTPVAEAKRIRQEQQDTISACVSQLMRATTQEELASIQTELNNIKELFTASSNKNNKIFQDLNAIIENKKTRLNNLDIRQAAYLDACANADIHSLQTLDLRAANLDASFTWQAGQSAITTKETKMIAPMERLQREVNTMSDIDIENLKMLIDKCPSEHTTTLKNFLLLENFSPIATTQLLKLRPENLETLLNAIATAKSTPNNETINIACKQISAACMDSVSAHDIALHAKRALLNNAHVPESDSSKLEESIKAEHQYRSICAHIQNAIQDTENATSHIKNKSSIDITSNDIISLLQNPPKSSLGDTLDILLILALQQAKHFENPQKEDIIRAEVLAEVPESMRQLAKDVTDSLQQLHFSSSAELNKTTKKLISATKSASSIDKQESLHQIRPDIDRVNIQQATQAFATNVTGIHSPQALDMESLIQYCNKTLQNQDNSARQVESSKLLVGAGAFIDSHLEKGINAEITETYTEMVAQQRKSTDAEMKQQPVEAGFELKGEGAGYSFLVLQRLFVEHASDLSAYDLKLLGTSKDEVTDKKTFVQFMSAPERQWEHSGSDWGKTILLADLKKRSPRDFEKLTLSRALKDSLYTHEIQQETTQKERINILQQLKLARPSSQSGLHIQLEQGRTSRTGGSDESGAALKLLLEILNNNGNREKISGAKSNITQITVGATKIDLQSKKIDPDVLRQGILAILNNSSLQITTQSGIFKKTTKNQEYSYLNPVKTAHAALIHKSYSDKTTSASKRLEHAAGKAFVDQKSALLSGMEARITQDFAQTAGLQDRLKSVSQSNTLELARELSGLLKNAHFMTKTFPLALLNAFEKSEENTIQEFLNGLKTKATPLEKALQDGGLQENTAKALAKVLISGTGNITSLETALKTILKKYTAAKGIQNTISELFSSTGKVPEAMKQLIKEEKLREDTLAVLSDIQANSAIHIDEKKEHGLKVDGEILGVQVTAEMKAGKTTGVALWRDEAGMAHLNVNEKFFSSVSIGAAFLETFSLSAAAKAESQEGLIFSFPSDEACAQFTAQLMSGKANQESLALCTNVQRSSGASIAAAVGLEIGIEKEIGSCTLALDASAGLGIGFTTRKEVSGMTRTVFSESSFAVSLEASANLAKTKKDEESSDVKAESITVAEKILHGTNERAREVTADISKEGVTVTANLSYNVAQSNNVSVDLSGTKILDATSASSTAIGKNKQAEYVNDFCAKAKVPETVQKNIDAFIAENTIDAFTISITNALTDSAKAKFEILPVAEQQKQINDKSNYKFASVEIQYTESSRQTSSHVNVARKNTISFS